MDQTTTIPTFYTAPPTIQGGSRASPAILPGSGAISGGLLRPGAIDQTQFKAMLAAPQAGQTAKQTAEQPLAIPAPKAAQPSLMDGIPTLTPAQFAVLTGGQMDSDPAAQVAEQLEAAQAAAPSQAPVGPLTQISGKPVPQAEPAPQTDEKPAAGTNAAAPTPEESKPAATEVAAQDNPREDPRVVHFKHMPDQDERKALSASGKRWVVDETPGSRKLFFGDDEKFGWDDLADLVNPLQHIPIVAQIYRAVTGDQINGAAELLGALPFGPSSFLTSVADLAVRESTGKDMGSNVVAMLFGHDNTPAGETPGGNAPAVAGLAATPGDAGVASNGVSADAIQTASIQPSPGSDAGRDNGGHDS